MKNLFKQFCIIALVAIIGFTMMACGDDDTPVEPPYTPITQIPDNYLNTKWRIPDKEITITFGSDASKFDYYQLVNTTYDNLSPATKEQIAKGYNSGLNTSTNRGVMSFKNDGSSLFFTGNEWVKQ